MNLDEFAGLVELLSLAFFACAGLGRAIALRWRGVRVIVVDRERGLRDILRDGVILLAMLALGHGVLVHAWPLPEWQFPGWLNVQLLHARIAKLIGVAALISACAVYGLALKAMGDSWRMGVDRQAAGRLVTQGVFALSRNPIYVALNLFAWGVFLAEGRLLFLLVAVVISASLHGVIRLEEKFLTAHHGPDYERYRRRVPRYVAWRSPDVPDAHG